MRSLISVLIVLSGAFSQAGVLSGGYTGGGDSTAAKKGSFALLGGGTYGSTRLLNSDGTYAAYSGTGIEGMVIIDLIGNEYSSGISIFGQLQSTDQKTSSNSPQESLAFVQGFGGVLAHLGAGFSVGFGYGTNNFIQRNYGRSASFSGSVLGAGLTLALFRISGSLDFFAQGWYKTGFIPKTSDLTSNSGSDQVEGSLGIRWSPNTGGDSYL